VIVSGAGAPEAQLSSFGSEAAAPTTPVSAQFVRPSPARRRRTVLPGSVRARGGAVTTRGKGGFSRRGGSAATRHPGVRPTYRAEIRT
jgi:hypothetical protein